jgi:hypothetical protein
MPVQVTTIMIGVEDLARSKKLVGVPPSTYRRQARRTTAGMPSCVAKQVTRPIRNREASVTQPQLS